VLREGEGADLVVGRILQVEGEGYRRGVGGNDQRVPQRISLEGLGEVEAAELEGAEPLRGDEGREEGEEGEEEEEGEGEGCAEAF
jgi:hypothetical protein